MTHDHMPKEDTRSRDQLPRIDILGNAYTVDWKNRKLLPPQGSKAAAIELSLLLVTRKELNLQCLYNKKTLSPVAVKTGMSKPPSEIVVLEIPSPGKLDPIAVALEVGIPLEKFLHHFPVQPALSARQVPWKTSRIKEFVSRRQDEMDIKRKTGRQRKIR